jgi:DNA-directed RNA polymerase specialized sigma24 family protein
MVLNSPAPSSSFFPPQSVPEGAGTFAKQVHKLLDGQPKDDTTVNQALEGMDAMFDQIAAGLYSLASMLAGEGEEGVRLVEKAIATADISACDGPVEARRSSCRALVKAALKTITERDPDSLTAPAYPSGPTTCIEDDELDSVEVSAQELEHMLAGSDRDRVREWLSQLPMAVRTVFALRAVAGFTAAETAGLLVAHGGPSAAGWSAESVRDTFRQGLCALASQLLHSSTAR